MSEWNETPFDTPRGKVWACWRSGTSDYNNILASMCEDEYHVYDIEALPDAKSAGRIGLDIGAHIGGVTLAMCNAGFGLVRAVEPFPENIELLTRALELNDWLHRVQIYEGALSSSRATVAIGYGDDSTEFGAAHQFIGHPAQPGERVCSTRGYTWPDLLRGLDHVDLLKLDCEGGEWDLTPGVGWEKVRRIAAELHMRPGYTDDQHLKPLFESIIGPEFTCVVEAGFPTLLGVEYARQ